MFHLISFSINEVSDHGYNWLTKTEKTIKNTSSFGLFFLVQTNDIDNSRYFSRIKRTINMLKQIMNTAFLTILNGETENVSKTRKYKTRDLISVSKFFKKLFLKLVSAIIYQISVFPPTDSPSKTMKSGFYFIKKVLFVLKIFKLLYFFPFLSTLSRYKRTNGSGKFVMS